MSVLEVLIALAILALASIAGANWIRLPETSSQSPQAGLLEFFARAKLDVLRAGEARLLTVSPGEASVGALTFNWDAAEMAVTAPGQATKGPLRLVLFPDRTVFGPPLEVVADGKRQGVPLVYRAAP